MATAQMRWRFSPWDSIYFIADGIVYQLGGSVTRLTELIGWRWPKI